MAREAKVFAVSVDESLDPYPFVLSFQRIDEDGDPVGEPEDHEFTADGNTGARAEFAIAKMVRFTTAGDQKVDPNAILGFMQAVLVDGDFERLIALIERRDLHVRMEALSDVFSWLVTEMTGRPTRQSNGSPATASRTGVTSTAKRPPKART